MKFAFVGAACLLFWSAAVVQSQVVTDQASTVGESYARGMSDVILSQGQKNLSDSQAAINLTDARSNQIDNQVKSVNAYWEKKDIYSEHQQKQLAEVERKRQSYINKRGSLDFSSAEFDRTTGTVNWIKVLEQPAYDQYRKKLDELFHDRSYNGFLTGDQYLEATTTYNDWRAAILQQKDDYPAPVLDQMLRFLLKAKRELDDNLS